MTNSLQVITEQEVLGKAFKVYGTQEEPLFLAKDVAEMIEYDKTSTHKMLESVDEDEKLLGTIFRSGQNRELRFLTEHGLYEVLMQSRKPIAKQFKKRVKTILKDIRKYGMYINDDFAKAIIDNPQEAREEMSKYFNESQRLKEIVKSLQEENSILKQAEVDLLEVEKKLEFLQDRPENTDWKTEANKRVRQLTPKITGFVKQNFGQAWNEVYREMLYSENINIKAKHTRRLKKMEMDNIPKSTIDNTKIIDTIGTDIEYVDKMFNAISNLEEKYTFKKNETSQEVPCCFGDELLDF